MSPTVDDNGSNNYALDSFRITNIKTDPDVDPLYSYSVNEKLKVQNFMSNENNRHGTDKIEKKEVEQISPDIERHPSPV